MKKFVSWSGLVAIGRQLTQYNTPPEGCELFLPMSNSSLGGREMAHGGHPVETRHFFWEDDGETVAWYPEEGFSWSRWTSVNGSILEAESLPEGYTIEYIPGEKSGGRYLRLFQEAK